MLTLIIDTSTEENFLGLMSEGKIVESLFLPIERGSSQQIMARIDDLLTRHKLSPHALTSIAVCVGPGSFTGTRVGVMTAKALAYGLHIELIPFYSLETICPEKEGLFASAIDGKSGTLYLMNGFKKGGKLSYDEPPFLIKRDNLPQLRTLYSLQPALCEAVTSIERLPYDPDHLARRLSERESVPQHEVSTLYLRDL